MYTILYFTLLWSLLTAMGLCYIFCQHSLSVFSQASDVALVQQSPTTRVGGWEKFKTTSLLMLLLDNT